MSTSALEREHVEQIRAMLSAYSVSQVLDALACVNSEQATRPHTRRVLAESRKIRTLARRLDD